VPLILSIVPVICRNFPRNFRVRHQAQHRADVSVLAGATRRLFARGEETGGRNTQLAPRCGPGDPTVFCLARFLLGAQAGSHILARRSSRRILRPSSLKLRSSSPSSAASACRLSSRSRRQRLSFGAPLPPPINVTANLAEAATNAPIVEENDGGEFVVLRAFICAPPRRGLEQRLGPKRPQEPGGCVKSPIAPHPLKQVYVSPCRTYLQRIVFGVRLRADPGSCDS
jgi:hypothetical protein